MKKETVINIIDEMKNADDPNSSFTNDQLKEKYNDDELIEAVSEYAQIRGVQIQVLDDAFVGGLIMNYEQRTGENIDKDGLIEELVVAHFMSQMSGKELFLYNEEEMMDIMDISAKVVSIDDIISQIVMRDLFGS